MKDESRKRRTQRGSLKAISYPRIGYAYDFFFFDFNFGQALESIANKGEKEILIRRNEALIADNEKFRARLLQTEKDVADTKGELELIDDLINR